MEIQVHLYDEKKFPPGTLIQLWSYLNEGTYPSWVAQSEEYARLRRVHGRLVGKSPRWFWADGNALSVEEFVRYFGPESGRLVFLPFLVPAEGPTTVEHVIGICWLDEITRHRSFAHFAFFWWAYGRNIPATACRKGLELAFTLLPNLQLVLGRVNVENRLALATWEKIGMKRLGSIPGWFRVDGISYAAEFGYLEREQFHLADSAN